MEPYVKHADYKTILIDALHTLFIPDYGFDKAMVNILKRYKNPIIITTNMNRDDLKEHPLSELGYEIFTREGNPNKRDSEYWKQLLENYNLTINHVVAFDHNPEVVKNAYVADVGGHYIEPYGERDYVGIQKIFICITAGQSKP